MTRLRPSNFIRSSEVNSGLFYKTAAERERLLQAEREYITRRVHHIIELKKKVCDEAEKADGKKRGFVIINQKVRKEPEQDRAGNGQSFRSDELLSLEKELSS